MLAVFFFFFSSRRRHTRLTCDWSSDVALPIWDKVKAGAPLVEIDPSQQRASVDQSVATRKLKEATLRNAEERAKRAESLRSEERRVGKEGGPGGGAGHEKRKGRGGWGWSVVGG